MTDYTATQAALAGYTRGAARDLGPRGITVNIVQAGLVDTEMNPADTAFAAAAATTTALGRYARPEEIAAGVAFLARPDSTYVTGTVLDIDGAAGTAHEHIAAFPRARSRSRPTVSRSSPNTRRRERVVARVVAMSVGPGV